MDAGFTAEQNAIRRTLRHVLDRHGGPDEVRAAARSPQGYDTGLWAALARDHGLPGLAVPVAYGGAGRGTLALALAGEETGRALLPSPLVPTACLVAPLVLALGTEAQRAGVLPRLASGELTGALAVPPGTLPVALGLTGAAGSGEPTGGEYRPGELPAGSGRSDDGRFDSGRADSGRVDGGWPVGGWSGGGRAGGIQAHRAADGWRLYGEAAQVLGGHSAGLLLVAAHAGGFTRSRTLLFLVADDAAGLLRVRHSALDETRAVARVELRDVRAELLGGPDESDARPALAALGPPVAAVLAMEAVGAADGALTRTVEQVTSGAGAGRRPCGSRQAVRTRLAEAYLRVRTARAAASYAAWVAGTDEAESRAAAGTALAVGLEALRFAAGEAVRLHGEAGSTREQTAHLSFRRAAGDDLLFGPVHRLRHQAAEAAALYAAGTGEAANVREGDVARRDAREGGVVRRDAREGDVARRDAREEAAARTDAENGETARTDEEEEAAARRDAEKGEAAPTGAEKGDAVRTGAGKAAGV
ncbi:acyl-CoA dehydrogenase family protein [Streptomyces reniochalinae]|uniref:Acyl-CoA dehydrogenase n=1 Tax=Streptomyces reniochalinae TaxID=2250578 RepID=A0A367EIR4_9ACTN|nr:acyl-CoA dehydrogenase [Streptomyces reniochalinae]